LRTKILPDPGPPRTGLSPRGGDEAEPAGCGGSTVKGENEVWQDFRRNPGAPTHDLCVLGWKSKGRGQFSSFRRQSSLADTRYASLLTPRTEKNWLPALHAQVVLTGPRPYTRLTHFAHLGCPYGDGFLSLRRRKFLFCHADLVAPPTLGSIECLVCPFDESRGTLAKLRRHGSAPDRIGDHSKGVSRVIHLTRTQPLAKGRRISGERTLNTVSLEFASLPQGIAVLG